MKRKFSRAIARSLLYGAVVIAGILFFRTPVFAGPPFLTDDPDPVPYQHWELYTFASGDRTNTSNSVDAPAIEINNGVAPNTQLHLIVPEAYYSQPGTDAEGLGDTEFGIKYRFLTETKTRPEVGIFPLAELATGDSSKNLGNGKTWYKLPLWIQKSVDRVTIDSGGGFALNSAAGQRNYSYGGLLGQYELDSSLTLGGEIFQSGSLAVNVPSSSIWNIGGSYNFTPDFSLLFSAGHSFQGQGNSVYYLSLYRTWGPGSP